MDVDDLVGDIVTEMNKHATSAKAYLQGDHANHTWGVLMPLAMQWVVGGSNVWPLQRYLGISGEEKSFKSTLTVEMGNWFVEQNGVHVHLDTEHKTSPDMLDAMSRWWQEGFPANRRVIKLCSSITEWQTEVTKILEKVRKEGDPGKGKRMPLFFSIDSLMGRSTEDADRNLRKEGFAAERGFPVSSLQVTNYLEALNLLGTTCSVGWVQHMKQSMDQTGYGVQFKEKGAKAAQFSCSTHLRVNKGSSFNLAKYDGAPFDGFNTQGHDIWIRTARSCVGPGDRSLSVPLCWQYPVMEEGNRRQCMWFDWDAALGQLLCGMKYNDNFKPKLFAPDKEALKAVVDFTEVKKNSIKCKALGLEGASYNAFGKALQADPDVLDKLTKYLGITQFSTVQDAEIDFEAGNLAAKKKKTR